MCWEYLILQAGKFTPPTFKILKTKGDKYCFALMMYLAFSTEEKVSSFTTARY